MILKKVLILTLFIGLSIPVISSITFTTAAGGGIPPSWNGTIDDTSGATNVAKKLTDSHYAWRNPNCTACHGDHHNSKHTPPDCASCHGTNGANPLPNGHPQDYPCLNCHQNKHAGLGFKPPGECQACHRYNYDPASGQYANVQNYDAVVIGSGGGGLSAAAALAKSGFKVLLLEQHSELGGCMTGFIRGDYRFEASLHGFNGWDDYEHPDSIDEYWFKLLGIWDKVKPVKGEPYMFRVKSPTVLFDVAADVGEFEENLKTRFPAEADNIEAFMDNLYDLWNLLNLAALLLPGVDFTDGIPDGYEGLKVQDILDFLQLFTNSSQELLDTYFEDESLKATVSALSMFLGERLTDLSGVLLVGMLGGYHMAGYYYFEGGSWAISKAMAEVVEEYGGTVKLNTLATKIVLHDDKLKVKGVETDDGSFYTAKYVISNASMPSTLEMVGDRMPKGQWKKAAEKFKPAETIFNIALGIDTDIRHLWPEGGHTLFLLKSNNFDTHFDAINDCDSENVFYGVTNFSVSDPTAAPPGKNALCITSMISWDCVEPLYQESYEAYKAYKDQFAAILIEQVEQVLDFNLSEHIETIEVSTPKTVELFTLAPRGTIFGKGYTYKDLISLAGFGNIATPVNNLFMAGSWTFPGGGQAMVMLAGTAAAYNIILQEQLVGNYNSKKPKYRFPDSLHATRNGMRTFCEAKDGDEHFIGHGIEEGLQSCEDPPWWCAWCEKKCKKIDFDDLSCKNCHSASNPDAQSCDMCHTDLVNHSDSIPDSKCLECHKRQAKELSLGFTDVHSGHPATNECKECHFKTDIHGNSKQPYQSMFDKGARETTCTRFGCHFGSGLSAENHTAHKGKLDCSACHVKSVTTCYNCHMNTYLETNTGKTADTLKDWLFLVNDENGKVRAGNFQSLTFDDASFVVFAPYHSHSVTKENARQCGDCHNNAAVQELDTTGKIVVTSWNSGILSQANGVIPVVAESLQFAFLDYDMGSDTWSHIDNVTDNTQYGYCTPLTQDQVDKLLVPQPGEVPELPVVITEIHYEPTGWDATYEFAELYNPSDVTVNISGYVFDNGAESVLPDNTFMAPGEVIVLAQTPGTYSGNGYRVFNMRGNLLDAGELLQLFDNEGSLVDAVRYDNKSPWPTEPDNGGPSLELKDPSFDNSLAVNWQASSVNGGTPGTVPLSTKSWKNPKVNLVSNEPESLSCGSSANASVLKIKSINVTSVFDIVFIMFIPFIMIFLRKIKKFRISRSRFSPDL